MHLNDAMKMLTSRGATRLTLIAVPTGEVCATCERPDGRVIGDAAANADLAVTDLATKVDTDIARLAAIAKAQEDAAKTRTAMVAAEKAKLDATKAKSPAAKK